MKILIAYASKYGCTEKCVKILKEKLETAEVTVINLAKESPSDLQSFSAIVVGGPIYAGNLEASVKKFCEDHLGTLLTKKLALFLCCGNEDQFEAQLNSVFDRQLIDHAVALEHFGYEYQLEKMGFFFRLILRVVAKVRKSESRILDSNIARLADKLVCGE